jgi:AcrR family transcriptional regulator
MAVRPPQQARSRATWTRVLDAGVDILQEQGHEALTIASLCERAGVTPPTVYARAPDKATLLRAIHDHAVERFEADLTLAPGTSPGAAVAAIAHSFLDNGPLLRAVIRQAGSEPQLYERGSIAVTAVGDRFRAAVGGDERRADACFRIVVGALAHRVVDGPQFSSDLAQSDAEFIASLSEMAERYLAA